MPQVEISGRTIALRPFQREDLELLCDYWYRSPPGFVESLGIAPELMLPEPELRKRNLDRLDQPLPDDKATSAVVTITHDGRAIGSHSLSDLVYGESALFHAHIWDPTFRRRGVGSLSYPMACRYFFQRFQLKRIQFKTPALNAGPNRVKERLGFRKVGEGVFDAPFVREPLPSIFYEVTPEELGLTS